jgi:hypothetical protein
MDANFRLKLRNRHIKNDPELGPGWAYCVHEKNYQNEMDQYGDQQEVSFRYPVALFSDIADFHYRLVTVIPACTPLITPILDSRKIALLTE